MKLFDILLAKNKIDVIYIYIICHVNRARDERKIIR